MPVGASRLKRVKTFHLVEEGGVEEQEQPKASGLGMIAKIFAIPKKKERQVEEE